jgi:hypothetical protein
MTTPGIQAFNHFGFDAGNFTNLLFKFWAHGNPSFSPKNIGYISNDPSNALTFQMHLPAEIRVALEISSVSCFIIITNEYYRNISCP